MGVRMKRWEKRERSCADGAGHDMVFLDDFMLLFGAMQGSGGWDRTPKWGADWEGVGNLEEGGGKAIKERTQRAPRCPRNPGSCDPSTFLSLKLLHVMLRASGGFLSGDRIPCFSPSLFIWPNQIVPLQRKRLRLCFLSNTDFRWCFWCPLPRVGAAHSCFPAAPGRGFLQEVSRCHHHVGWGW